jgi:hypothetical protein
MVALPTGSRLCPAGSPCEAGGARDTPAWRRPALYCRLTDQMCCELALKTEMALDEQATPRRLQELRLTAIYDRDLGPWDDCVENVLAWLAVDF